MKSFTIYFVFPIRKKKRKDSKKIFIRFEQNGIRAGTLEDVHSATRRVVS